MYERKFLSMCALLVVSSDKVCRICRKPQPRTHQHWLSQCTYLQWKKQWWSWSLSPWWSHFKSLSQFFCCWRDIGKRLELPDWLLNIWATPYFEDFSAWIFGGFAPFWKIIEELAITIKIAITITFNEIGQCSMNYQQKSYNLCLVALFCCWKPWSANLKTDDNGGPLHWWGPDYNIQLMTKIKYTIDGKIRIHN